MQQVVYGAHLVGPHGDHVAGARCRVVGSVDVEANPAAEGGAASEGASGGDAAGSQRGSDAPGRRPGGDVRGMAASERLRGVADIHGRGEQQPPPTRSPAPPLTLSPVRAQPPPPPGPQPDWASVGNHRFEVLVTQLPPRTQHGDGTAVSATLPWRRHDNNNATALVVLSSATSLAVPNCATVSATAESAEIIFSAADGP